MICTSRGPPRTPRAIAQRQLLACIRCMRFRQLLTATVACAAAPAAADVGVGVGLSAGVATGPNVQVKTTPDSHVDVAMNVESDRLRAQADYDIRIGDIGDTQARMPYYVGVGAFVSQRLGYDDVGVRIPFGLQGEPISLPIQIFGEISGELSIYSWPTLSLMSSPSHDRLALRGLVGVRASF